MKNLAVIAVGCVFFALIGCSTKSNTVVLPEDDGVYKVVALNSSENAANQEAVSKATETCNDLDKSMVVQNHASKYQGGMAKGDKELLQVGSEIASMFDEDALPVDASSSNDYKVVIEFKCK
ncbi:MAG: hypothetical protein ACLFRL_07640 [Desulfohalobiaceae bacterium]